MNSTNKVVVLVVFLFLLPLSSNVCIADSDTGSQSSTSYAHGAIFDNVRNIVHWNGSCSYSPNPNVADEMALSINVSVGEVNITIISFDYTSHVYEFYAYPNTSATTVTVTMTGITQSKPWDFLRGSTYIYNGNIFTNATGGISFTFSMNAVNQSFKLSQYGAGSGSPEGPGGGPGGPSSTTTTAVVTTNVTANVTTDPGEGWVPPSENGGLIGGIEEATPLIIIGILISLVLIATGASSSNGVVVGGYIVSVVLGGLILFLLFGSAEMYLLFCHYLPQILLTLTFVILIIVAIWLIMAGNTIKRSEKDDASEEQTEM